MTNIDYVGLGKRIRKFRMAKGWTQTELASQIQMSNITISHLESGSGKPQLLTVILVANALEVTLDDLLCDSLNCSHKTYKNDLLDLFEDCNQRELQVLLDITLKLKEIIRQNFGEKDQEN